MERIKQAECCFDQDGWVVLECAVMRSIRELISNHTLQVKVLL